MTDTGKRKPKAGEDILRDLRASVPVLRARIEADAKRIKELNAAFANMTREYDKRGDRIAELEALLREADRRIVWEGVGFGNDFAARVEAALGEKKG